MTSMKKVVVTVFAIGLVVSGMHGVALAGKNNPNLAATGHPGYAPDYYYPMTTAQSGQNQNVRRDVPSSPYWNAEGAVGGAANSPTTSSRTSDVIPFSS